MINLNSYGNCTDDSRGTGIRTCDIQTFGDVRGISLLRKGFFLDVTTDTLNEATWTQAIQNFDLFPFNEIYNFEQTTPDNEVSTSSVGILSPIRAGKPQFTFSFDKGGCFHKALYDKRSKGKWDLALLFDTGLLMATNINETQIKGFNMGLFDVETFRLLQGTDPQMSMAKVQLLDAQEFNMHFQFFTWEQLGFNALEINGVVDVDIIVDPVVDGDTGIIFKIVSACNNDDIISSLNELTNYSLTNSAGLSFDAVAYNPDTQKYQIDLSGSLSNGDTFSIKLIDGSFSVAEDALGQLFKGQSSVITVESGSGTPPSNLTYNTPNTFDIGIAITNLTPSVNGVPTGYTISPSLPAGLSLNSTTGVISGTPTVETEATNYTITATNSSGSTSFILTIVVNLNPPSNLSYPNPNEFVVGTEIDPLVPTITGFVDSYEILDVLPLGLVFDSETGIISGTPSSPKAQQYYTVLASNSTGSTYFKMLITVGDVPDFNYPESSYTLYVGEEVIITPNIDYGSPITFVITPSFSLPAGLSLNSTTGVISGTPTVETEENGVSITGTNDYGSSTAAFYVQVLEAPSV